MNPQQLAWKIIKNPVPLSYIKFAYTNLTISEKPLSVPQALNLTFWSPRNNLVCSAWEISREIYEFSVKYSNFLIQKNQSKFRKFFKTTGIMTHPEKHGVILKSVQITIKFLVPTRNLNCISSTHFKSIKSYSSPCLVSLY